MTTLRDRLQSLADEDGGVTVEAALAIATLVAVLMLCLGALMSISAQLRCQDAAREAARLAARGDRERAIEMAARVAPAEARIAIGEEGDLVVATVEAEGPVPMLTLVAEAVAAREPEGLR